MKLLFVNNALVAHCAHDITGLMLCAELAQNCTITFFHCATSLLFKTSGMGYSGVGLGTYNKFQKINTYTPAG